VSKPKQVWAEPLVIAVATSADGTRCVPIGCGATEGQAEYAARSSKLFGHAGTRITYDRIAGSYVTVPKGGQG
jgi:hypothetical protein